MKRRMALLLVLVLLFSLGACGVAEKQVRLSAPAQPVQGSADAAKQVSLLPREKQTRVSRSDMTVLYFDEASSSVSVYDAGAKQLWRALPEHADGENHAMLRLRVLVKDTVYTLSSQTDATAAFAVTDGVLRLTFDFVREFGRSFLHLTVPMTFAAEDGTMRVEVDCAALKAADCSRDVTVLSIEVLPSFGAASGAEKGDFLFVPDGCGATVALDEQSPLSLSLPVYGDALSLQSAAARVAAFGMKRGEGAFVALVENGDALAAVTANRASGEACSTVGAAFAITESRTDGDTLRVLGKPYTGVLSVAYRFLTKESADVAGMAAACRELLVRGGMLDYLPKRKERTALPLSVTLIGTASFAVPGQGSFVSRHTVTTLSQAQDILQLLRSKGISDMDVMLSGFLRGDGKNGRLHMLSAVQDGTNAKAFFDFAASQNAAVYPGVFALTAAAQPRSDQTLQTLSGSRITAQTNITSGASAAAQTRLLRAVRSFPCSGLSLGDVGLFLPLSGAKTADRQAERMQMQQQLSRLFAAKPLCVSGGNLYALKFASLVTGLPNTATLSGEGYRAVPFLQMLLHGYSDYSGTPLNLAKDAETAFLRAAEYGETPSIVCYYNDYGNAETTDNCNYQQAASIAQQSFERLGAALNGLGDRRITAHEEVKNGVFATTFGNASTVYVNYNANDVTVHGVTVEGRSVLRVN